ncbi:electron transport complex subunit RsxC [Teredinibacter turnerae]|uniref:electron transport complex subunit RsxC n=1 Tax=Teredinibacter turnerae TaxID=2426 RepID=UPI000363F0D1|nr:electron transport complex subunit RsxC [Teredinibacter turnerae]
MSASQIFAIHGGVHPPENKHQSTAEPIGTIPLANEIVLPLSQHLGAPATPIVAVGDRVLKGQIIADADGLISAPVHASTSGKVVAIESHPIPHPSGVNGPCIVIEPDHEDRWANLSPCDDYRQISREECLERIRNAGVAGMGGAGFPAAVKLNPRANQPIDTLILNGTECEPYITADDMLMREKADEVVAGALLLGHLLGNPANILIGIEDNKPEAIATMRKAAEGTSANVVVFPTKYPSGGEKQLIEIVTGRQVPSGALPANIGIVVQNVGTARAAWRAVRYGEPLISRITTVVGRSLAQQRNIEVPLGTPIVHVLKHHGWNPEVCARLIIGGPMMGFTMENALAPVVKTTNCLLVPSHDEMPAQPPAQACIRCGMCAQACPASLLPQQMFWYAQSEDFDKLKEHNLFDCIECGACSYVCPSSIPLVQYYRASKGEIRRLDKEKEKSDRSRLRFEARKERIAQMEAEKEAKRLARKAAAEAAKKATAEKTTPPLVADAVTESKTTAVDPNKELAKLERALSSAKSRVERAQKALDEAKAEGADQSREDALSARLKQAEQKVQEAQQKLDGFSSSQTTVDTSATAITQKLALSPTAQLEKSISSIEKRLQTAREKHRDAETTGSPSAAALKLGVEKLEQKLETSRAELAQLQQEPPGEPVATQPNEQDAAQAAIAKAKARAAEQAAMSDEDKHAAQVKSLQTRLTKARARLEKAQQENDENLDAFATSVAKLEQKLEQATTELSSNE